MLDTKNKAIFLDRDGVLNDEIGEYVWNLGQFKIVESIIDILKKFKKNHYKLIVVTNQSGISKKVYGHENVTELHNYFQKKSDYVIDHFYCAPGHPSISESLSRKPNTLMFEKAIAKFNIDPEQSWMIGDKERDIIPARCLNIKTIYLLLNDPQEFDQKNIGDYQTTEVQDLEKIILAK